MNQETERNPSAPATNPWTLRWHRWSFWLVMLGVVACGIGAKWQLLHDFGSDVPYMDQWNGEATSAIQPWLDHQFDFWKAFWSPHNEHRIGWTRIWALALTLVNGQWDPLFVASLNALIHVAVAVAILILLRRIFAGPGWGLGPTTVAALLVLPVSWENTLAAFQVQFYLAAGSAVVVLACLPTNHWRSWKWWFGLAGGVFGLATMASSFLAPAAAIAVRAVRAWQRRSWKTSDTLTIIVCGALVVVGWRAVHQIPAHARLHAHGVGEFFLSLAHVTAFPLTNAWPLFLILQAPLLWWACTRFRNPRSEWSRAEWFLLGFATWLGLSVAALAYGRGGVFHATGSRYTDTYGLLLVANAAALGALWLRSERKRLVRRAIVVLACGWTVLVTIGLIENVRVQKRSFLDPFPERWETYAWRVRDFVISGDAQAFQSVPIKQLPFISHEVMIHVLEDPAMRRVLPASIREPVRFAPDSSNAFNSSLPDNLPNPEPLVAAHYDAGAVHTLWRSQPIDCADLLPILRITFAGDPRLPYNALRLETDDGRKVPLEIAHFRGRWQTAHLFIPAGAKSIRLVAEAGTDGKWLAFLDPTEIGFGSWLMRQMRKEADVLVWIGLAVLAAGLALRPPESDFEASGPKNEPSDEPQTGNDQTPSENASHRLASSAWPNPFPVALRERWRSLSIPGKASVVAIGLLLVCAALFANQKGTGRLSLHVVAYLLVFVLLGLPTLAAAMVLRGSASIPSALLGLASCASTAAVAYLAFWAWLLHPAVGWAYSIGVTTLSAMTVWKKRAQAKAILCMIDIRAPTTLMLLLAAFYLEALHLHAIDGTVEDLSMARLDGRLPPDLQIPRLFAERLEQGTDPRHLMTDWHSSDRPPLQTGIVLLTYPWTGLLIGNGVTGSHAAGVWFQLLWVPAIWGLARGMCLPLGGAFAATALTGVTGFTYLNSVFVWPKLGAAALVIGAFTLYFVYRKRSTLGITLSGGMCALAMLAHGGVAFAILPMGLLACFSRPWPQPRTLGAGILVFASVLASWTCYQRFYDPPGNRLLKWHLGGSIPVDTRGTLETLIASYDKVGWEGAWRNKKANFDRLFWGNHSTCFQWSWSNASKRQIEEFFFFFRTFGPALFALPLFGWVYLRRKRFGLVEGDLRSMLLAITWVALTLAVWVLLMFGPNTTSVHQGSYTTELAMFLVLFALTWLSGWPVFLVFAALQLISFGCTWLPANKETMGAPTQPLAVLLLAVLFAGIATQCIHIWRDQHRRGARSQVLDRKAESQTRHITTRSA